MNRNTANFVKSFIETNIEIPFYTIDGQKYISSKTVELLQSHLCITIMSIENATKESTNFAEKDILDKLKDLVKKDVDCMHFENPKYVVDINLRVSKVYPYEKDIESYMENTYGVYLGKELKNYENNPKEFTDDNVNPKSEFTTQMLNTAKLFRIKRRNK